MSVHRFKPYVLTSDIHLYIHVYTVLYMYAQGPVCYPLFPIHM